MLAAVLSTANTTNEEESADVIISLKEQLYNAFRHAQQEVRDGELPSRSIVRFTFNMMSSLL